MSSQPIETILPEIRDRIAFLVETAVSNGSTISVDELRSLMPINRFPTGGVLKQFLTTDERLSRLLAEVKGEITLRGKEDLAEGRQSQRVLAHTRLAQADDFLRRLGRFCPWIELAGISGSTAYAGTKPEDDLDFFLVVERRRLWISLLLAMATARFLRLRSKSSPVYCFNRVVERADCELTFRATREPLFAREALNLVVLRGNGLYGHLLASAGWIERLFPRLFAMRLNDAGEADDTPRAEHGVTGTLANAAAFLVLGPYLWLAGLIRNVRLRKAGRERECFRAVVRTDHYATESTLYDELREEYRRALA